MRFRVQAAVAGVASGVLSLLICLVTCGCVVLVGCQQQAEITSYTVKKLPPAIATEASSDTTTQSEVSPPVVDQGPPDRDRMLAAIVPHGKMAWFFKMTGPREPVAEKMGEFLALLGSLKFADGDEAQPDWTLPEGWTSEKGSGFRFATLKAKSGEETLETTVIPLPAEDPTSADYVLSNVNRWCEQMGLPALKKADLTGDAHPPNAEVRQIEAVGTTITLANLVGRQKSGSMGAAPFAGGKNAPSKAMPTEQPRKEQPRKQQPLSAGLPKWTIPDGWKETEGNQFSLAAFAVQDAGKSVKTTVSSAGGDLLANVNRWRGQLQLPEWSQEEMSKAVKTLTVDGIESPLVELVGTDVRTSQPSCTLGVIVPRGGQSWFFKLTGDASLAQREKANFEKFVQSVKFPK